MVKDLDLRMWHLLTPFPKNASLARSALRNLRNFACCFIIFQWAASGLGQDVFKLSVGIVIVLPLLLSGLFMIIVGAFAVLEYLEGMEERYRKEW